MTKEEAQEEVLRRWRALPVMQRQTIAQAVAFAKLAGEGLEFQTLANRQRLIEAWLVRDLENRDVALRMVDARTAPAGQAPSRGIRIRGVGNPAKTTALPKDVVKKVV